MADLKTWPIGVRLPMLKGHSYTPADNILHTKLDSGAVRSRRVFKNKPFKMPLKLLLNHEELSLFEYWEVVEINGGADWFSMPIKLPTGMFDASVKIVKKGSRSAVSQKLWRISLELLVKVRPIISADTVYILTVLDLLSLERAAKRAKDITV
jgi:hypothetical protein